MTNLQFRDLQAFRVLVFHCPFSPSWCHSCPPVLLAWVWCLAQTGRGKDWSWFLLLAPRLDKQDLIKWNILYKNYNVKLTGIDSNTLNNIGINLPLEFLAKSAPRPVRSTLRKSLTVIVPACSSPSNILSWLSWGALATLKSGSLEVESGTSGMLSCEIRLSSDKGMIGRSRSTRSLSLVGGSAVLSPSGSQS